MCEAYAEGFDGLASRIANAPRKKLLGWYREGLMDGFVGPGPNRMRAPPLELSTLFIQVQLPRFTAYQSIPILSASEPSLQLTDPPAVASELAEFRKSAVGVQGALVRLLSTSAKHIVKSLRR